MQAVNPATGELIQEYPETTPQQAARTVHEVHDAFVRWRATALPERAQLMRQAAAILRQRKVGFAKLMAQEYEPPVSAGNGGLLPGQSHGNGGQSDAPPCSNCGWIMTRCGTCYRCDNCGTTSGCG